MLYIIGKLESNILFIREQNWGSQKWKIAGQNKSSAKNSFGTTWYFWKSLTFLLGSSKLQNVSQGHNTKEISNLDIIIFMFFLHIVRWGNLYVALKNTAQQQQLNTQFMTNSTLVSPVKMEYGWNFSISGLKMMMKSGLGKIFLKFLHALTM